MSSWKTSSLPSPPPQGYPDHHLPDGTTSRSTQMQLSGESDRVSVDITLQPPSGSLAMEEHNSERVAVKRRFASPRRTDHTYNDYAEHPPSPHECPITKKSNSNFPAKLHRMISNPVHFQAIKWQPHGRAWKVIDKKLLVEVVIPKYFLQTKYESFTRQLSGWGFKKLYQTGPDYQCYYHECFLRGLPHLTRLMKKVEPHQGKLLPNVEAEPNFSVMPIPLSIGYTQPPPPVDLQSPPAIFQANVSSVGYPQPNWASNIATPVVSSHPYGYYHYQPQGHLALAYYPMAQQHREIYANDNHQQQTREPYQRHPMHQYQDEHSIPPNSNENSAWTGAAKTPSQQRTAYYEQAEPAHPPNSSGDKPHILDHQHQKANNYKLSLFGQNERPAVFDASDNVNTFANLPYQPFRPDCGRTFTLNPNDIRPHAMQHQRAPHNTFEHLQQRRFPHVNSPDRNTHCLRDQSRQPRSVYDTPNPNEMTPRAMQHQLTPYDSFLHLQEQLPLCVKAPSNNETLLAHQSQQHHPAYDYTYTTNPKMQHQHLPPHDSFIHLEQRRPLKLNSPVNHEIRFADQSQESYPDYDSTYTPDPFEMESRVTQHQHSPFELFSSPNQQQPLYINDADADDYIEMNPENMDKQPNKG